MAIRLFTCPRTDAKPGVERLRAFLRARKSGGTIASAGASMVSPNVNRLLEVVKSLTLEERRQLRGLLDEPAAEQAASKEEDLAHLLLERGIITRIRPKPTEADIARFDSW